MADQSDARLEEALRNAAAAGDDEAATRIAQVIRSRRANTSPEVRDVGPPDAFSNVPIEINGVQLSDETRRLIMIGREAKDPKEKRILAARLAGRFAKEGIIEGDFIDDIASSQFGAALRGFGAGLFGLGDVAAATGTFVRSQVSSEDPLSFGEALEAQREFRRALEEDFPITSGLAEIGGAFAGGAGVGLAARGLARGGTGVVARAVTKATTLQPGQGLKNVARLTGAGAVAGGVTEGLTEGEPVSGAGFGAVAGPVGVGVLKTGTFIGRAAINRFLKSPAANGLRILAKKIKETPQEMAARFLEFLEVTGKPPSMNDIVNGQAVAELRTVVAQRTGSVAVAREAAQGVADRRSGEIAEQVTGGRVTTTQKAQDAARIRQEKIQFAEADKDIITFDEQLVDDLLSDPDLRSVLPPSLKRRLDAALNEAGEGSAVELKGSLVNSIRRVLRKKAFSSTGQEDIFAELADDIDNIAREQSPAFARAISESSARFQRGEGVAAGRKILESKTREFEDVVETARGVDELAGLRVGARSALADKARESSAQAVALVRSMAEDSGLVKRLRTILPAREVDRFQKVGRLQRRAAENLNIATPEIQAADAAVVAEAARDLIGAGVAVGGKAGGAFVTSLAGRILNRLTPRLSRKAANSLAADLFDPSKTEAAIDALRNAGISETELLGHWIAAIVSGQQAASAIDQ